MSIDRHSAEIEAIRHDVVTGPGVTERADRARVMAGDSPRRITEFLGHVRHASYRVTDEEVAALKAAGMSEDEIYELTVAAAVGIALDRLESAMRAMRGAP